MDEKSFIEDNKSSLVDEMAAALNDIDELFTGIISGELTENTSINSDIIYKQLMAVSQSLGYLIACFNQYCVFLRGEIPKKETPNRIGFGAMLEKKEKEEK